MVETAPLDRFLQAAARSGLIDRARLQGAIAAAPAAIRTDPTALAAELVKRGLLTKFQAGKLLQGTERGLVLGPYQILSPLGRGGFATVYLARDVVKARLVALKILPPKKAKADERLLIRFRREIDLCRLVKHPNLAEAFDGGDWQGIPFLAMEFVPGRCLHRTVRREGPLPVWRAARIFEEVAAAVGHAHARGLIHRDLKPSNVMVTPHGHAKVLDLGLAIMEGEELPTDRTIVGGDGYVVGTMDYIAPEQTADPTGVDGRADLYALGCSLYFALTGQPPFPGGNALSKISRHQREIPRPVTDLNPTVPSDFARLLERLMAKRPEDRLPDAAAVRKALLPWRGDEPEFPFDEPIGTHDPTRMVELVEAELASTGTVWETLPFVPVGPAGSTTATTLPSPPASNGEPPPVPIRVAPPVTAVPSPPRRPSRLARGWTALEAELKPLAERLGIGVPALVGLTLGLVAGGMVFGAAIVSLVVLLGQ